jgi:hypothetical protein
MPIPHRKEDVLPTPTLTHTFKSSSLFLVKQVLTLCASLINFTLKPGIA